MWKSWQDAGPQTEIGKSGDTSFKVDGNLKQVNIWSSVEILKCMHFEARKKI